MLSHKLVVLSVLVLNLVLHIPHDLLAQEMTSDAPIIALVYNDIYAVSPHDGEARLLVERSGEPQERLEAVRIYDYVTLSRLSPDNTKFVYAASVYEIADPIFDDKRSDLTRLHPNDLTLVDIASGEQTPITDQGAHLAEAVDSDKVSRFHSMAWSVDGQRLYFVTIINSMRNRVPQTTIEYYDLQSGERHVLARVQQDFLTMYAVDEGVVAILFRETDDSRVDTRVLTYYGLDGNIVNSMPMPPEEPIDYMSLMMPIFRNGNNHYGFYPPNATSWNWAPALVDVTFGETILLSEAQYPGFLSHTHADTSLQLVYQKIGDYSEARWVVIDPQGTLIPSMTTFVKGEYLPDGMALSPDGQSVAILDRTSATGVDNMTFPAPIVVFDDGGIRTLSFRAHEMMWGSIDFIFAPVMESD